MRGCKQLAYVIVLYPNILLLSISSEWVNAYPNKYYGSKVAVYKESTR